MSNKAIVGFIGCFVVGAVSIKLASPGCLWAIVLVTILVDQIRD